MSQSIRDLAWAINSPSLIRTSLEIPNWLPPSEHANYEPFKVELEKHLQRGSGRLVGKYFERLVQYYLVSIAKRKMVAIGRQIQRNDKTAGEIDFVFQNESGELEHWETAIKFYLHFPVENLTGSHLIGPNPADTFETKYVRMFEHQLPLGKEIFPEIKRSHAFFKGRIYYHPAFDRSALIPRQISPHHESAFWVRPNELEVLPERWRSFDFVQLEKPYWLGFIETNDVYSLTWHEFVQDIKQHFARSKRPRHLAVVAKDDHRPTQLHHLFVVNTAWPEQ